ncbi:HNH endonuclease [Nostoc sp. UCD121]|uniref:HNH endonuclease n=1 Tax=unclassified Nostoc TaxID=2593658 RepID=UPI00162467F0|nr:MULTISPECIES: HNH endonuclease [unclassified Nostoc]MBC1224555.1 HNH endonuclease [Nostoc sp. UCD120]MBC1278061.1 HNH endonuclease [Nostoc sp. UCD121]MBC1297882.1 HNH endonuclease [Nostoc sp. UCD122]
MTGKNRSRYSSNWDIIALEVKSKSDWKCTRCGMQCLRPTDKRDGLNRRERSIKTLVVHHRNYTPEDNRAENLAALCTACHMLFHTRRRGNVSPGQLSLW